VVRTRVGYAGGGSADPSYYNLADHSETIQIDFDPTQVSYDDLLEVYWDSRDHTAPSFSRQYASVIFYHSEEQRARAQASMEELEARTGRRVHVDVVPAGEFYPAEDYHQKYYLQNTGELMDEFRAIYPDTAAFVDSTAVARANGYVGGNGSREQLDEELPSLGLSPAGEQALLDAVSR
jgi:peptide-methionine (S)-S-oxide reductase